jgi:hypothetical protein
MPSPACMPLSVGEATACQRRVRSKSKRKEGNLRYPINKHSQDKNGLRLRRLSLERD